MPQAESYEPPMPVLPGSISTILEENPKASYENAVVAQAALLKRYREAAAVMLGLSAEELHEKSPTAIKQQIINLSITGEAA